MIKDYKTKEECQKHYTNNTNPKYKNFKQFIFTCGDKDDLKKHLIKPRKKLDNLKKNRVSLKNELEYFHNQTLELFQNYPHYKYSSNEDVYRQSLKYLFLKIKFGIYVRIQNNKLTMFVPFNNQDFKNNWSHLIKIDNKTWEDYNYKKFIKIYKQKPNNNSINFESDKTKWEIDNCVLDTRKKRNYRLINASYYISLLNEVCKLREISDVEFFINHRDFPVLKKDYTQPYHHLYNSDTVSLEKKYKFKNYLPIISMSKRDNFMDILFPTVDDWEIVNQSIHYGMCRDQYINFEKKIEKDWNQKIPTAIFRGATTDCGYDEETSQRYLIHKISEDWKNNKRYNKDNEIDKEYFLNVDINAGITKVWFNDIKLENKNLNFPKQIDVVESIEFLHMSKYKYVINIDGSVTAFRLTAELAYMSVILKVESEYNIWYSKLLKPYIHYIPIKKDFSDLAEKITWCKMNDGQALKIAQNAYEFYRKYINKEFVLDYIQDTLNTIAENSHF